MVILGWAILAAAACDQGGSSSTATGTGSGTGLGSTTGGWVGPTCHSDRDCNGGQLGTATICGSGGYCVAGCRSDSDCGAGDRCDTSISEGECTNGESVIISVPATSHTFEFSSAIRVAGKGADQIGAIDIAGSIGTVDYEGDPLPALAYVVQPFGSLTLYQILAVRPDALVVVWAYCQDGSLIDLYRETSDGVAVTYESASGTCSDTHSSLEADVFLPAFTLNPPPGLAPGVTIDGTSLSYDGGSPGRLDTAGSTWAVYPFNTVDCSSCGVPGWFEIHSVLWDSSAFQAAFGIFYLIDGQPNSVQLSYSLVLPTLASLDDTFAATWTHP